MIVRLMGGLGNQMFQYAFGATLGALRNEDVLFCRDFMGRPYGLDAWQTSVKIGHENAEVYREPGFTYDAQAVHAPRGATFIGYWQTEKHFNEALVRQAFQLRNASSAKTQEVAEQIKKAGLTSAFLHVRRGDYTQGHTNAYHGMPTLDYYRAAAEHILLRIGGLKVFVFSDDPDWCRTAFPEYTVVDHNLTTPHEDMWLMSLCQHGIVANSSFSWWGAWLGDRKTDRIVVAPAKWFQAELDTRDLIPSRWTRL